MAPNLANNAACPKRRGLLAGGPKPDEGALRPSPLAPGEGPLPDHCRRLPFASPDRLKVFFSQHGPRGVARVYVDLDGLALVKVRPGLGIFLLAKTAAVVAHLLFGIVVDVGQRSLVVGIVQGGFF